TEEAARLKAEEESLRFAAEAQQLTEQARLRTEEEAHRRADAEARLKEEEARRLTEEAARLKAEEESLRFAAEAQQLTAQARLRTQEEASRRAEAEARLKEEEALRLTEEAARLKAEEESLRFAAEAQQLAEQAHLRADEEAYRRAEAEARLKAEEARRLTEEAARLRAEEESLRLAAETQQLTAQARLRTQEEASRRAEAEARLKEEEARRLTEEAARLKAEEESLRFAAEAQQLTEQARLRTEEETRKQLAKDKRFNQVLRSSEDEERGQTISSAYPLESAPDQSLRDSETKRCPKCSRVYRSPLLAYCSYDAALLVTGGDPAFNEPIRPNALPRPTLWALVMITFLGSLILSYLGFSYIREPSAARVEIAQPAKVEQNQPVIGGTLNGKEATIPNPEYPASAKSKGASGEVKVEVRVNKKGIVVSARALNGHPLLKRVAEQAARKARFSPEKLADQRSIVSGTITYNFQ
ncbi:MAG: TonB family protein, partial [Pyrinomonadaceae bacterium]|nr:TonB family protein [Pyrinomonadaceae bacterium]